MQWGDIPTDFASGTVSAWRYFTNGAVGYEPSHYNYGAGGSLVRLVAEDSDLGANILCTNHISTATCDIFDNDADADVMECATYLRYEDDYRNGVVFYMGGNNVNGVHSQLRMILNALVATPAAPWVNPPPPVPTV